jgi:hypothetical protein
MAARGSIAMQWVAQEVYKSATDPASPTDGLIVYNTAQNVLKKWDAATSAWVAIADYNAMTTNMGAVQNVTTYNSNFLGLLACASYGSDGLTLKGLGEVLQLVLGAAQITFKNNGEAVIWIGQQMTYLTTVKVSTALKVGDSASLIPTANGFTIK